MRHLTTPSLLALVLGVVMTPAAAPPIKMPASARAIRPEDQLDYVYLASDRPIFLRLHLRLGDKPFFTAWDAYMDKLFAWVDTDKNGFISPAESKRMMAAMPLLNYLQGSYGYYPQGRAFVFANLDRNQDGKLSKEEFKRYYRLNGLPPVRFSVNTYQADAATRVNKTIWNLLDTNGDGKLSEDELNRAPTMMKKKDENEDELLTSTELDSRQRNRSGYAATLPSAYPGRMAQPAQQFVEIPASGDVQPIAQQILKKYDTNKDRKLSPKEIAFPDDLFKKLDTNKDGFLTLAELTAWFAGKPDLVFRARVGPSAGSTLGGIMRSVGLGKKAAPPRLESLAVASPLSKAMKRLDPDTVRLPLGDADVEIQAGEGFANFYSGIRRFYISQFKQADIDKKGYLEKSGSNNVANYYISQIFDFADRDGNGKLTLKELEGFMDIQVVGAGCWVTVDVQDKGRNLFNIIDTSKDGRLSLRELRNAWKQIKPLTVDGKALAEKDLRRHLTLGVGKGNSNFRSVPFATTSANGPSRKPAPQAPAWFSRMDLNGDGDLSFKEWVGSQEDFDAIDTDGDGLISVEEAKAYESRLKKGKK